MTFALKGVSYGYVPGQPPDARPFAGISVDKHDFDSAGITAIVGPSGSGKTTLLSILAGFIAPQVAEGGHFHYDGVPIGTKGHLPGRVAFVFQSSMLLGGGSGVLNAIQGRVADPSKAVDPKLLGRHVDALGLGGRTPSLLAKRARLLSGGEAQRVAILRALYADPEVILCDEPTSNLDLDNAKRALEALTEWSATRGRPVLWVTHNLDQAAQYADRVVLVSNGHIAPGGEDIPALRSTDAARRLDDLRARAAGLSAAVPAPGAVAEAREVHGRPMSRFGYAARAAWDLSTDGPTGAYFEQQRPGLLLPDWARRLLDGSGEASPARWSPIRRAAGAAIGYSQAILIVLFVVIAAQIWAADFFGRLAQDYSRVRLQDPSVARITFDHDVFGVSDEEPQALVADTMRKIEADIRTRLALPAQDATRVAVHGRRVIDGSALRITSPDVPDACRQWQSPTTVSLERGDPILRQTALRQGDPVLVGTMGDLVASPADGARARVLMEASIVDLIRGQCGIASGRPILADWAASPEAIAEPVGIEVAAAVETFPPLYPNETQMLVFDDDYLRAINRLEASEPQNVRVANVYFPIEKFGIVAAEIRDRGYVVRDDSAAAVATLQGIARAAEIAPRTVALANLIGCAVLVVIVLDGILKLNRRVFALLVAHGFQGLEIGWLLALHLLPAFVVALGMVAVGAALVPGWLANTPFVDFGDLRANAWEAFVTTSLYVLIGGTGTLVFVVTLWWYFVRAHLKTILQE